MARHTAARKTRKVVSKQSIDQAVKLFDKLMAETKPYVPADFPEKVERDITGSGVHAVNRRMALVFLSRPFPELANKIREDRATALAFAEAAACIKSSAEKYKYLADVMATAEIRIQMALCQRADMTRLLAEVRRRG